MPKMRISVCRNCMRRDCDGGVWSLLFAYLPNGINVFHTFTQRKMCTHSWSMILQSNKPLSDKSLGTVVTEVASLDYRKPTITLHKIEM